jgi:hypothetical protein
MAEVVKGRLAVPRSLAASPELKLQGASAVCKRAALLTGWSTAAFA